MKKTWYAIIVAVLIAIMLGVVAVGVGLLTGADLSRIYNILVQKHVLDMGINILNKGIDLLNSVLAVL